MKQLKQRMNLMLAIVIWVFFAVLVLLAVFVSLWFLSPVDKETGLKPLVAIVTASLTSVGGIGAVAYLVMKYRERQDKEKELEQEEANQRRAVVAEADRKLNDAVAQLGSESPQVRLAGVYALADVADTYLGGYKQRVVDILCGYLRTDRSDQLVGGKFKDAAVESAIIKVIGEHLRKDREELKEKVQTLADEKLWCDCSFDFRGATFTEPVLWEKTLWNKTADFSDSEFSKDLRFQWAKFAGETWFDGASFAGET
ncbi:MAG: pentapeptide repeat-containing protein, partial [Actinomycetaceae bacterium]|nr:pentapeptide repeat-containing protein [Actinomycetaceae bacterium]